jgi:hypothetical protein
VFTANGFNAGRGSALKGPNCQLVGPVQNKEILYLTLSERCSRLRGVRTCSRALRDASRRPREWPPGESAPDFGIALAPNGGGNFPSPFLGFRKLTLRAAEKLRARFDFWQCLNLTLANYGKNPVRAREALWNAS